MPPRSRTRCGRLKGHRSTHGYGPWNAGSDRAFESGRARARRPHVEGRGPNAQNVAIVQASPAHLRAVHGARSLRIGHVQNDCVPSTPDHRVFGGNAFSFGEHEVALAAAADTNRARPDRHASRPRGRREQQPCGRPCIVRRLRPARASSDAFAAPDGSARRNALALKLAASRSWRSMCGGSGTAPVARWSASRRARSTSARSPTPAACNSQRVGGTAARAATVSRRQSVQALHSAPRPMACRRRFARPRGTPRDSGPSAMPMAATYARSSRSSEWITRSSCARRTSRSCARE